MSAVYVACVGLYVVGLLIRDGYELLKKAGRIDTRNAAVFAFVFISMCVMWVSWFAMGVLDPTTLPVPDMLRWVGLGAVLLGAVLAIGGMWQLRGVENIDHLVTAGLFSRIRHPMYAGFLLWIVGWSVYQDAAASLAVGVLGIVSIVWWRQLEERELESCYGAAYAKYRATTWF